VNLDQIIESLGLDKLGSSQRRESPQPDGTRPEGEQLDPGEDSMADGSPEDSDDWDEPAFDDEQAGEVAEEVAAPAVEEVRHDIDQLSAEVDSNASAIRGMESQQDDLLERVERIEEHNARLLGVYDRLTAGINPFDEDWDVKYDQAHGDEVEDDEPRYGVIDPPESVEMESDDGVGRDTVSFEDLKQQHEDSDSDSESDSSSDATEQRDDRRPTPPEPAAGDAYLDGLAPTYATDVLVMEWLTMLIRIAGAPGALKALDYYENIDWINEPVKRQVENVLSGVDAPDEAEPRPPGDLTTEEHNRSFAFVMKLAQQRQPMPTRAD
jgi:archaellum component FlaD/FlaE